MNSFRLPVIKSIYLHQSSAKPEDFVFQDECLVTSVKTVLKITDKLQTKF